MSENLARLRLEVRLLNFEDSALALDTVEHTGVIDRDVLFSYCLNDLLRYNAASESSNIVELRSTCSGTIMLLVICRIFCRLILYSQLLCIFSYLRFDR